MHAETDAFFIFGLNPIVQIASLNPSVSDGFICREDLDKLNQELTFLHENDPDGETASGNCAIDDSLFDGSEVGDNTETNAEVAEAETKAAEPKPQSASTQYLRKVLDGIVADLKAHCKPLCYCMGDFWIRPKHPAFALEEVASKGFTPTPLYERNIFLWIPDLLATTNLRCSCGHKLVRNGKLTSG